ncbi:unnamed protein product [Mycena citricolor]|uniref:Uncharacterized protein n=1 Tax=Mycena citricolor TaxID=2018698 RepID=A0AAD2H5P9_9AGAR|nr:unnamed protein product [Mycena citricolor]
MFSISQIALTAAAFAAFTTAAPIEHFPKRDLIALPAILIQLSVDLAPVTASLSSITSANATAAVVQPIAHQLSTILSGAVSDVSALAGSPLDVVLATTNGVLGATQTAQLVAPVVQMVLGSAQSVLNVAGSTGAVSVIQPILNDALSVVNPLLSTGPLSPIVNGLLVALVPVLTPLTGILNVLGLGSVMRLVNSVV